MNGETTAEVGFRSNRNEDWEYDEGCNGSIASRKWIGSITGLSVGALDAPSPGYRRRMP
jgi:hypothetical protein